MLSVCYIFVTLLRMFSQLAKRQVNFNFFKAASLAKSNIAPVTTVVNQFSTTCFQHDAADRAASKVRTEKTQELLKNRPKKPLNAYLLFSAEQRPIVSKENPGIAGQKLVKTISERWNNLSAHEQQPYRDLSERNSEKHRILVKEFEETLPPKKPAGPYVQFSHDIRKTINEKYPDLEFGEKAKITSQKWKELDQSVRDKYKEEYARKTKEWKQNFDKLF